MGVSRGPIGKLPQAPLNSGFRRNDESSSKGIRHV